MISSCSGNYEHVCSCFKENPKEKQEFNFISRTCNLLQDGIRFEMLYSYRQYTCRTVYISSSVHFAQICKSNFFAVVRDTQLTFTCSKSTIKTVKKGAKYVQS